MSALGAAVGKGISAVGGPQVAALVVVGGLIVGALGGGFIVGGLQGQQATTTGGLAIYPCPDSGPALATVGSGQKFLVTGKTADSSWVRIYYPLPDRTEAWVTSGPLQINGSLDAIPVVPCAPVIAGPGPAGQPGSSLTALEDNSPSPATPSLGPSAPPSTPPPNGAPVLARLASTSNTIAGGPQRYCTTTARSITVSVRVTDAEPIGSVVLSYRRPGLSGYATKPMTRRGGANTWQATLRTDTDGIDTAGDLRYFVSATDSNASPRTGRLPADGARSITVAGCANQGPTFASLRAAPGSVFTNLQACAGNATTTTVSAAATDVDGVSGMTLHYHLPGDPTDHQAPMAKAGGAWTARVNANATNPNARGTAAYSVTGRDALGKTSRSGTRSFKVTRCNFPAVLHYSDSTGAACPVSTISLYFFASDRDGLAASGATVFYTYVRANGKQRTLSVKPYSADQDTKGTWSLIFHIPVTNDFGSNGAMTAYLKTTDRYGGTGRMSTPNSFGQGC